MDVDEFATHLTTINLATRDLIDAENYPQIARSDFFDIEAHKPFMSLPTRIKTIGTHMPEQDLLIILLAKSGIRGLIPIPHEQDECQRVLQEYGDFIRRREDTVWELIGNRTHDEDLQEKIYAALMLLMTREDNPG